MTRAKEDLLQGNPLPANPDTHGGADRITQAFTKAVASILATGQALIQVNGCEPSW